MAKEIKSQKEFQREMSQVEKDQKVVLYICNCPGCYPPFCNNGTNCKEFKVRKSCIGIGSKSVWFLFFDFFQFKDLARQHKDRTKFFKINFGKHQGCRPIADESGRT